MKLRHPPEFVEGLRRMQSGQGAGSAHEWSKYRMLLPDWMCEQMGIAGGVKSHED